jgi:threonine/homoserine/homoserine lactone efflux protein
MPDASTIAVFAVAAFVLLIIPGPAVLYIVARGIHQGRPAALVSVLGIGVGSLVHVAGAALGLSALLVSSAVAFSIVKYLGAAYLIYLGLRTMLARDARHVAIMPAPRRLRRIFLQGVIVQVLNPKIALFFFAFLPQFVDPGRGAVAGQVLFLGGLLVGMGVCSDGLYALLAGSLSGWLKGSAGFLRSQRYVTGSVYIGLGVTTALTGRK